MNEPPTERLPKPFPECAYSVVPENGGYAVVHTGDASLGCIRFAKTIVEAQEIIRQLQEANA